MPAPLQAGTFLIASLGLEDPNFTRTVVLILQHVPDQVTLGVVINRPLGDRAEMYPGDELKNLAHGLQAEGETSRMFFQGGPVEPGSLIFLHRVPLLEDSGTEVCPGLYAGGDLDALRAHAGSQNTEDPILRFYLGYADWSPGQLEAEIDLGAWILCPGDVGLAFSSTPETIWQRALRSLGGKYVALSFIPEDPSLN